MNNTILLIANDYTTIVDFRLELIQGLIKSGYNVVVALPDDDHNSIIRSNGASTISLNIARQGKNPIEDINTMLEIKI